MITFYFPPRPSVASLRTRGLAKYLPEYGWEPVILTAELPGKVESRYRVVQTYYPGDAGTRWKARLGLKADKALQEQIGIPKSITERKSSPIMPAINMVKSFMFFPDEQKGWLSYAVDEGARLFREESFDAIISSSGPATCHLIANMLKSRFDIPWIADFRDLWTQSHYYPYLRIRRIIERRLEIRTLRKADALVTVSGPLAEQLKSLHQKDAVFVITNGYDPDEVKPAPLTEDFTITYTGLTYQGKRDPSALFRAVSELIDEGKIERQHVRIRFFGTNEYWLEKEVKRYNLQGAVDLVPWVSRDVALERQRESQILLLLNWDHPHEIGVYTGKIFEYLAARRPILAIGNTGGVVGELLKETCAGVNPSGYEQLKNTLEGFYYQYRDSGCVSYEGREEKIAMYSHREMAQRFAEIIDALC